MMAKNLYSLKQRKGDFDYKYKYKKGLLFEN